MTRAKGRGNRVAVDFRCHAHDRRMGMVWVDQRQPEVLCSRVPGGGSLPGGWRTAVLVCGVCGLGAEFDSGRVGPWLAERARSIGPSTLVWSIRPDDPTGGMVRPSSRVVSGAAAGQRSTGPSYPRNPSPSISA